MSRSEQKATLGSREGSNTSSCTSWTNLVRLVSDRREEGITVGEVSVCGVGHHADLAGYLT
jgi:hypothetical protein